MLFHSTKVVRLATTTKISNQATPGKTIMSTYDVQCIVTNSGRPRQITIIFAPERLETIGPDDTPVSQIVSVPFGLGEIYAWLTSVIHIVSVTVP